MSKIFIDMLKEHYPEVEFAGADKVYVSSIQRLYFNAGVQPPSQETTPLLVVRGLFNLAFPELAEEIESLEMAQKIVGHDLSYDGGDECIMCSG